MLKTILKTMVKISYCIIFLAFLLIFASSNVFASENIKSKKIRTPKETLLLIDKYQEKYFEIIKRNDYLLQTEASGTLNSDKKELKKLYSEVKKQVKDKKDLKEYKGIAKRNSKCDEITTTGINECAYKHYQDIDNLLNKVYGDVKTKISSKDFQDLATSEKKWLKEVDNYEKVFNSMDFGTIGTLVYYGYNIDMREFRTLLLMLYL